MNSDVIERLKEARKKIGLTQTAMAKSIGITPQSYSEWERLVTDIPQVRLFQICTVHGISKEWLETGEGEMLPKAKEREEYAREALFELGVEMFKALPDAYKGVLLSIARRIISEAENANKPAVDHTKTTKEKQEAVEQKLESVAAL